MITLKSQREIALIRNAGKIIAEVFDIIAGMAKPGVETIELDRAAEACIRRRGAIPSFKGYRGMPGTAPYPASICASLNDQVVHGIPDRTVLRDGDILSIDVGTYLEGYHADAARTFAVGDITETAARLIRVTEESFRRGIEEAVPGRRISDVSAAVQAYVEQNGFSAVRDYVGHGIGKELHEPPQIPNYNTGRRGPRIQEGMTLAIEPMVNEGGFQVKVTDNGWTVRTLDGKLSAHYENTVAVTGGKPEILTI
ncbi:MAG: type I methionyl aminopeptidase [Eubacteriales bacterium]|nr:type I methionyl aminopeptidase [Eubacteriales bacterium]